MLTLTHILLVDDEPFLLEVGKEFLESRHGLDVDTADSAKEGIARFNKIGHDVIVSDFQMPEMDGIELLKHLRSKGDRVPFILFTGRGREEVAIRALNHGADYYLKKEGDAATQYAELANMVERSTARRRLEIQLKEKTDLLGHAEKMGRMGCWEYDFLAKRYWCSEEVLQIIQQPESFLTISLPERIDLVVKEDRPKLMSMIEAAKFDAQSSSDIIRIWVKRDRIKTCAIKIQPVTDNSGRVFKIISIIQDMTGDSIPDHPVIVLQKPGMKPSIVSASIGIIR
jgi:DNA-binding response OmpR family regulator